MDTTAIVLASRPQGAPHAGNFRIERQPLPRLGSGQVLLRTIYLSLDPYMRGRMDAGRSYAEPVALGAVMEGETVSAVLDSRSPRFVPGDLVLSKHGWQTHAVQAENRLRRIIPGAAPLSAHLGILGMPGYAAYLGITEIARPEPGETFVVAAASGPVGSTAGQLAKMRGSRVVGIVGGPRKTEWVRKHLGFDEVLDHRAPSFREDLASAVPDGIDVYFENVGGHVWDTVFEHLADHARVPVCGLIAQYNTEAESPARPERAQAIMRAINVKRLRIQGFTQRDYSSAYYKRFQTEMSEWWESAALCYLEDVVDGLENAPEAFFGLLEGRNFGKLVIRVSPEP